MGGFGFGFFAESKAETEMVGLSEWVCVSEKSE